MSANKLQLIGCASGLAGADERSGLGPLTIQQSDFLKDNKKIKWRKMFQAEGVKEGQRLDQALAEIFTDVAKEVSAVVKKGQRVCVVGGDHSSAIGTWSGVYDAIKERGDLGLIWIDAHMDSHTPETSPSGNVHGMPHAVLLGYGYDTLTRILHDEAKVKPHHTCLIGVRSFEKEEAALLERLNVRVYLMDEVLERGFSVVLDEAILRVSKHTAGFGVTIDIDAIDPQDAPGVDVPEPDGIRADEICEALKIVVKHPKLIATEIVEFDPSHDEAQKTEKLFAKMIEIIAEG